MNLPYWIIGDAFIFKPEFNGDISIYIDKIIKCKILIFSEANALLAKILINITTIFNI